MKKYLVLLLTFFALGSCEQDDTIIEVTAGKKAPKVDVCHEGKIISINENMLKAHLGHGDAVDMDGDGFFDQENDCSDIDCDDATYSEDNSCGPEIGDLREGGIVFMVDETGQHGVVCAVSDASGKFKWNNAISFCNNYSLTEGGITYDDWYLPSRDELNEMCLNKSAINEAATANGGGNFNSFYWSSTEPNSYQAWAHDFRYGTQYYPGKTYPPIYVRAVRAF